MYICVSKFINVSIYSPVEEIIRDMQMMFEVDYLLPRSIMASITLGQLRSAIEPGLIPPYIVAACLFFHCSSFNSKHMDMEYKHVIIIISV